MRSSSTTLRVHGGRLALLAVLAAVAGVACQPVDPSAQRTAAPAETAPAAPLGAPGAGTPRTLADLLAAGARAAGDWEEGARIADVRLSLDDVGLVGEADLLYVAPDADRMLVVALTDEGLSQSRPTLATLSLQPLPADAVAAIPDLPAAFTDLDAVVADARAGADQCGSLPALRGVLYSSGAPYGWDGERFETPPAWSAKALFGTGEDAQALDLGVEAGVLACG